MGGLPSQAERPTGALGAVEGGGTRFVVSVRDGGGRELVREEVPTGKPRETLGAVREVLGSQGSLDAVGVACFGPLDSHTGRLLGTPKEGWAGVDLAAALDLGPHTRLCFETDVVGAALGEQARGAGQGCGDLVYVTVGTGIGAGILAGGAPVRGRLHPEVGHLRLARAEGDSFPGCCPFHGDCWEGLASGPAIAARAGRPAEELADDHPAWHPVVHDLAQGLLALTLTVAPERLLVGGGVGLRPGLLDRVRARFLELSAGYLPEERFGADASWLQPAGLGASAGIEGAFVLAAAAAAR